MTSTRYAVVTAPGYHGDWAVVLSTHRTIDAAQRAARPTKNCRYMVTEGSYRKGQRIAAVHIREAS